MKLRHGFVSNSSSSSYIIILPKKEKIDELLDLYIQGKLYVETRIEKEIEFRGRKRMKKVWELRVKDIFDPAVEGFTKKTIPIYKKNIAHALEIVKENKIWFNKTSQTSALESLNPNLDFSTTHSIVHAYNLLSDMLGDAVFRVPIEFTWTRTSKYAGRQFNMVLDMDMITTLLQPNPIPYTPTHDPIREVVIFVTPEWWTDDLTLDELRDMNDEDAEEKIRTLPMIQALSPYEMVLDKESFCIFGDREPALFQTYLKVLQIDINPSQEIKDIPIALAPYIRYVLRMPANSWITYPKDGEDKKPDLNERAYMFLSANYLRDLKKDYDYIQENFKER